jgi:integrase
MENTNKQVTVTLMIRVKIAKKWRRVPAIYGKTGRVIPGLVLWAGKELRFDDVAYELRHYKDGNACYAPAGKHASDAEEKRRTLQSQLSAMAIAQAAGIVIAEPTERKTIIAWSADYTKKKSSLIGHDQLQRIKYVISLFLKVCKKTYLDEITESDILDFLDLLAKTPVWAPARSKPSKRVQAVQIRKRLPSAPRTLSKRSIFSYFISARAWLCAGGVDRKVFPPPPKYEEVEVTVYSPEEISTFFSLVQGNLRIATLLMLKCGLRRREAAYAYFSDVNFGDKTILVRGKPEFNFTVKNYSQRYVPVPDDLIEELRKWQLDHPKQTLITQTRTGKPIQNFILLLKRFAYLHGLRCGRCEHCRAGHPECEEWELHKFRRTYITAIVRYVDLRTAQAYAGHKRITSTERYLKAASASEGQKRVSAIDFARPFYD